jgi:para-nitrobenzyl esterase
MPWYDGERLAREQEVVVVSVTHRLGALGYLHFPASEGPSNGMADQVTALQWVQANIGAFGGDPGNVTVFGQSAGGFSIAAMLAWGHGGKLFRRAILQSGAGGLSRTRGEAETVSEQFVTLLGMDPHTASTDGFVAAQRKLAIARKQIADWMPILPETPTGAAVDMIGGWTRDDALPFVLIGAGVAPSPGTERQFTEQTQKMNGLFEAGCRALVGDMAARGQRAFLYRFAWAAQQSGLGACHCIDLPFLLGDRNSWSAAPMLSGTPWDEIESKGRTLRAAWANFARGETPGRNWTACSADAAPVTELD